MNRKIRILVIDKDEMALNTVSALIKQSDPRVEVLTAMNLDAARRLLNLSEISPTENLVKVVGLSSMMEYGDKTVPESVKKFVIEDVPEGVRVVGASIYEAGQRGLAGAGCDVVLTNKHQWAKVLLDQLTQPAAA